MAVSKQVQKTDIKKTGAAQKKEVPHHAGHRDRLRQRFVEGGLNAMQDYELLELSLFYAIPRRDVKPLAKTLLKEFGSLKEVFGADLRDLQKVKGISENTAIFIKSVDAIMRKSLQGDIRAKPILSSWQSLVDYCYVSMAHEKKELFRVLFLNRRNQLISDEVMQSGTVDHTPVYPREIVKRALELGATAIILVHNHPSDDLTPSDSDILMTAEIIRAAAALDIVVHDHLIIGKSGHSSLKSMGLL